MIELADAIQQLREQLTTAIAQGQDQELQFSLESLEMELQITMTAEATGKGGIKLWLVDAGAEGKVARECLQRVKLVLKPVTRGRGEALVDDRSWEVAE